MNETLKAAGHIGAELGAALAEIENLRGLLARTLDYFTEPGMPEDLLAEYRAALSQQAEPECSVCGGDCSDANPPVMNCPMQAKPAPAQDERSDELEAIHQYAFEVGGTEGGGYILEPEELDEVVRRANEPLEDVLRSLACSLGAGGYNASKVDPTVFEQKIRWGIDQLTRPAQTKQQPVCWASSAALAKLRNRSNNSPCVLTDGPAELNDTPLYAAPIAQTAPQPEQSGLVEALRGILSTEHLEHAQAIANGALGRHWAALSATPSPAKRGDA